MTFMYLNYLPLLIIVLVIFVFLYFRAARTFKAALRTYWDLRPKIRYNISHLFYLSFIILLLVAAMDLRGPEETIEGTIGDQKTLIVIDSSASMLAEDVRPNRFEKAIMLAKHFVRGAYGHQVGIVVFSDIQKMLIPFTDDIDLLDARLGGLVEQKELTGGSNLYQTIRESIRYFVADGGEDPVGNILLFSDAEAHDETFELKVPDGINVAVVGVGTARGAKIPIRDKNKAFKGYKKFQGDFVTSSLNEDLLKDLGKNIEHYRYWIVQAYNLPTEEILSFFNRSYLEKLSKSTQRVRPVIGHRLIILAIICYVIAVLLTRGKTFRATAAMLLILGINRPSALRAQSSSELMEKLHEGNISQGEKLELAKKLMEAESYQESATLYNESLDSGDVSPRASLNYGTSLLAGGEVARGLEVLANTSQSDLSEEEKMIVRSNVLNAIKQQQEQQKQEQENKDQKDQKDNGQGQQDQPKDSQDGEKQKDQKEQQDQQNKNEQNKQDQQGKDQQNKSKSNQQKLKERQEKQKRERAMKKVPALVKQVLEDDRKLQEQYIDTSTDTPEDTTKPKDW